MAVVTGIGCCGTSLYILIDKRIGRELTCLEYQLAGCCVVAHRGDQLVSAAVMGIHNGKGSVGPTQVLGHHNGNRHRFTGFRNGSLRSIWCLLEQIDVQIGTHGIAIQSGSNARRIFCIDLRTIQNIQFYPDPDTGCLFRIGQVEGCCQITAEACAQSIGLNVLCDVNDLVSCRGFHLGVLLQNRIRHSRLFLGFGFRGLWLSRLTGFGRLAGFAGLSGGVCPDGHIAHIIQLVFSVLCAFCRRK